MDEFTNNKSINCQLEDMRNEFSSKIVAIHKKVKTSNSPFEQCINNVEYKIRLHEQQLYSSDIIISGIPFIQSENVMQIWIIIANVIKFDHNKFICGIFRKRKNNSTVDISKHSPMPLI